MIDHKASQLSLPSVGRFAFCRRGRGLLHPSAMQRATNKAVRGAGITKRVSATHVPPQLLNGTSQDRTRHQDRTGSSGAGFGLWAALRFQELSGPDCRSGMSGTRISNSTHFFLMISTSSQKPLPLAL